MRGLVVESFQGHGIEVVSNATKVLIGGTDSGAGNVIKENGQSGIFIPGGQRVSISANSIFSNGGLGIDTGAPGINANDPGDPDSGPNGNQNHPILSMAYGNGGETTIEGMLNSTPNAVFVVEFFRNIECHVSGNGEGWNYIGQTRLITDQNGFAPFALTLPRASQFSALITATATDANGNTSELSPCQRVVPFDSVDIALFQRGSAYPVPEQSNLVYTITITNSGPVQASGVVLSNFLPAGVTVLSANPSQGACGGSTGGVLTCSLGQLPRGRSALVSITVDPSMRGFLTNTVVITATELDNAPNNNISTIVSPVGISDLGVQVLASNSVPASQVASFTVTVTNAGPDGADDVTFSITSDGAMQLTEVTGPQILAQDDHSATLRFPFIPSGGSATAIVRYLPEEIGLVEVQSSVSSPHDLIWANNDSSASINVIGGAGVLQFAASRLTTSESSNAVAITVSRSAGSLGAVTVRVRDASGTATPGSDYTAFNQPLNFADGETEKTVLVSVTTDSTPECNEYFTVLLFNATGGAIIGTSSEMLVWIFDDDSPRPGGLSRISGNNGAGTLQPLISDNGRFIAYTSYDDSLAGFDTNGQPDVILHDRLNGNNSLISVNLAGRAANGASFLCAISGDGRKVAFTSTATDLSPLEAGFQGQIYVRDHTSQSTVLASKRFVGTGAPNGAAEVAELSRDGRYIVFVSRASNLLAETDANNADDVFWRDLQSNAGGLVSVNATRKRDGK